MSELNKQHGRYVITVRTAANKREQNQLVRMLLLWNALFLVILVYTSIYLFDLTTSSDVVTYVTYPIFYA